MRSKRQDEAIAVRLVGAGVRRQFGVPLNWPPPGTSLLFEKKK